MDLKKHVRVVKHFPVQGVNFQDITPLVENPVVFKDCIDQMVELYKSAKIDKIAAFDARGFLFGSVLAYKLELPLVLIRKNGKLPCKVVQESYRGEYADVTIEVHEESIKKGDNVLLVDDVIAVGGAMSAGCKLIEKLGGNVVGCFSVIEFTNLRSTEILEKYDVKSLIKCEKE